MLGSLISYQILSALAGGVHALVLCAVWRLVRRKRGPFVASDLFAATLLQIPAALFLLFCADRLFQMDAISSVVFFLVVGLLFYAGFFWIPLGGLRFALARRRVPGRSPLPPVPVPLRLFFLVYILATFSVAFYAWFLEPSEIQVSRHTLSWGPASRGADRALRLVHLSDIQTSHLGSRELRIAPLVEELRPDLVLFSGDLYTRSLFGTAPRDAADAVLSRLAAPFGFFGVPGDSETPEEARSLLEAQGLSLLRNETRTVSVRGKRVVIHGLDREHPDLSILDRPTPDGALVLLVTHSPDVILDLGLDLEAPFRSPRERAALSRARSYPHRLPDLILAGHTHGGQIVVPGWGAPITFTRIGPRFASGFFDFGVTRLHVSRGLGMEGHFAPRVRFLCPPEITLITVVAPAAEIPQTN